MCGVVGYIGENDAKQIILDGLRKMEYRGYDSAGIALYNPETQRYECVKGIGNVSNLEAKLEDMTAGCGIGHTRWATHGKPTLINAHPHVSKTGRFLMVHNGVIENHRALKKTYISDCVFISDTDSEVIVQLIERFAQDADTETAIYKTLKVLEGSYALLIVDQEKPGVIYAVKNKSPLLIGTGSRGVLVASDPLAMHGIVDRLAVLDDETFAVIDKQSVHVYDYEKRLLDIRTEPVNFDAWDTSLGQEPHYMLKEIKEQPFVIRRQLEAYCPKAVLNLPEETTRLLKSAARIYLLGAGTSMHACLVGKRLFERVCGLPAEVHIASEFAYHPPVLSENAVFILVSQSGETADLRACLKVLPRHEGRILTITNVKTSTLAREADYVLDILAGPEVSVASTKAYTGQISLLALLACAAGGTFAAHRELSRVAVAMEAFLDQHTSVAHYADALLKTRNCFFIGRGADYCTALEAAVKLKEISYIQAEGYAAGELKHGTIALIEENTPVVAIISDENTAARTRSNLSETESRGARTMTVVTKNVFEDGDAIVVDAVHPLLTPLVTVIPLQLFAYYAALSRGLNIDKPRNLAKSVTVE